MSTAESPNYAYGQPQLFFFTELDAAALQHLLDEAGLLDALVQHHYGIALTLRREDDNFVPVIRQMNEHRIPLVAWLRLPISEGTGFNVQNYPQAVERYRTFRAWAQQQQIHFATIGLAIEPTRNSAALPLPQRLRELVQRFWLSRENVLYPAARLAYTDLVAEIHHNGYELHTYQIPLLADDRRSGTTLAQQILDIVELPADVEVLLCYSSLPTGQVHGDQGGALIASYGPDADGIAVGSTGVGLGNQQPLMPLSWDALERDLLLAAHHTDVIYVSSLEGCVERGLLSRIGAIDWSHAGHAARWPRFKTSVARSLALLVLLSARFGRSVLAWLGWLVAAVLFVQQTRRWWRERLRRAQQERTQ